MENFVVINVPNTLMRKILSPKFEKTDPCPCFQSWKSWPLTFPYISRSNHTALFLISSQKLYMMQHFLFVFFSQSFLHIHMDHIWTYSSTKLMVRIYSTLTFGIDLHRWAHKHTMNAYIHRETASICSHCIASQRWRYCCLM